MADRANSPFNKEQQLFITRKLLDGEHISEIRRLYGTEYHNNAPRKVPSKMAFSRVANRLKTFGNTHTQQPPGRPVCSREVIERVAHFFQENDQATVRIAAEDLHLSYGTVWTILRKKLKWRSYKYRPVQQTKSRGWTPADSG